MHTLNYWTVLSVVQVYCQCNVTNRVVSVCSNATLLIVDLWQYDVWCIRSCRYNPIHSLYDALPDLFYICQILNYTPYFSRASSLKNLAVLQHFFSLLCITAKLADPVFDSAGLEGLKSKANVFLLAQAAFYF